MNRSSHSTERLDVAALAAEAKHLEGRWPVAGFGRLCEDHPADAPPLAGDVVWSVRGERRPAPGAEPQVWMHLAARVCLWRTCQRCLRPVAVDMALDRWLRFVHGEDAAAQFDADSEDDVLALERWIDLHALVEDELLLALPLVPMHDVCPVRLPTSAGDDAVQAPSPSPFASLADLRRPPH